MHHRRRRTLQRSGDTSGLQVQVPRAERHPELPLRQPLDDASKPVAPVRLPVHRAHPRSPRGAQTQMRQALIRLCQQPEGMLTPSIAHLKIRRRLKMRHLLLHVHALPLRPRLPQRTQPQPVEQPTERCRLILQTCRRRPHFAQPRHEAARQTLLLQPQQSTTNHLHRSRLVRMLPDPPVPLVQSSPLHR